MSLIKGMHHMSMKCTLDELEKVTSFYKDVLGLTVARQWGDGIMFDTRNGLIEIFTNAEEKLEKGVIRHFALATDDVDQCVKAVQDAGYEVFIGPKDIAIPSDPVFPARMAFCKGPLGEEIEFFEEQ